MAKRIFTEEQTSAIETRDKTLLVSAAAGSGKTATLTERIIRSVTDDKNPEDISRMLIVTFTNAAVKELRDRITAALRDKLKEEPENRRIEHQIYMLPGAKICTIDSFCNDILKNNATRFGISPRYRIADPIEANILTRATLSALIEAVYSGDAPDVASSEEFEELSACLTGVRNTGALEEVFAYLYEKSKSAEDGVKIFRKYADAFREYAKLPVEKTPYGKYAMKCAKDIANHYTAFIKKATETYSHGTYYAEADEYTAHLSAIISAQTYAEMQNAVNCVFKPMPRVSEKNKYYETLAYARDELKDSITKDLAGKYFSYTEEEWKNHFLDLYKLVSTLAKFLEKFDEIYFSEKKRRAMLEYSDIERLTYMSLYGEDGEITDFALSVREQFSSVYIDEYQDVNSLQNRIFEAISTPNNRFMVGDIKQSIYGFRSANPDIFAEMKNTYPPLKDAKNSDSAAIFMSKNFRCDKSIIDFVNGIFDRLFPLVKDSIGYVNDDRLILGKTENCDGYKKPEVMLFSKDEQAEAEGFSQKELPPLWIAEKIKHLIENGKLNSGENIRPKDIAIVLRKDGGKSREYAKALENLGIKATVPDDKDFFLNAEIQLALCLLNAIDNPRRDIYLAGLMLSPLFSFTADELFITRKFGDRGSLWQSLKNYTENHPEFEKGRKFIDTLNRYRYIAEGMSAPALILRLYNETGLLALGAKNGAKENLMLLYNYARKFEASSFEGLYNFIGYVNTVISTGANFSAKKDGESEDAVSIITVHKSKGLEYPVVFLADAATSLVSANERRTRVAFSEELGIAMKTRVPGGLALVESPVYNAIIDRTVEKSTEEELRVYYVALTRARERLYVVGAPKTKSPDDYNSDIEKKALYLSPYSLKEAKSFADLICMTDKGANINWQTVTPDVLFSDEENQPASDTASEDKESCENLYSLLTERFSYKYPNSHLEKLPEKLSISALYPEILDDTADEISFTIEEKKTAPLKKLGTLPEFISPSSEYESAKRGIATHNFLQFFDLSNFKTEGAEAELLRLTEKGFISDADAKRVRLDEIRLFGKSRLFAEMLSAKKLYREFRFNVMLPASLFTKDEEKREKLRGQNLLLQGVIDCLIEDGNGDFHLVDYKTDRLTKEELLDKSLAEKTLNEKHSLQLSYYALAVEKIFTRKPSTVRVYSLPLGDTVDIK